MTYEDVKNCKLGVFVDISNSQKPCTSILQLSRKALTNEDIILSEPYFLPLGKFYDVYSGKIFCGTLFEFSSKYKIRLDYNNFGVYSKFKDYNGVRSCSKNERWSCFVDEDNSALLIVSNMCFNLDIRK